VYSVQTGQSWWYSRALSREHGVSGPTDQNILPDERARVSEPKSLPRNPYSLLKA
jgi:hypothetical protein